jgi:GNAT superfamily N-acetyltransferase
MAVDIRSARADEAAELLPAYEWLFAPPASRPAQWDPDRACAALGEAIRTPGAEVLVAVENGEIVGICTVYRDILSVRFGVRAWVEDLAVAPHRRSAGIGARLLDAAKAWARTRGATHLELDSSTSRVDAHRFYEREQPSSQSRSYGWDL